MFNNTIVKDQVYGFIYAVGIGAVVAIAQALATASADDFYQTTFWTALAVAVVRSIGTAALTVLGIAIPGVSPEPPE